jgi:hypothetical protein
MVPEGGDRLRGKMYDGHGILEEKRGLSQIIKLGTC